MSVELGLALGAAIGSSAMAVVAWRNCKRLERRLAELRASAQNQVNRQASVGDDRWVTRSSAIDVVGACGARGCRNMKAHSHVVDLCRRIKGK